MKLMSLAYLVDNPNELVIVGDSGKVSSLEVNLIPVDENLQELDEDHEFFDDFIDDPNDLIGKRVDFIVIIGKAVLEKHHFKNIFVEFSIEVPDKEGKMEKKTFQTKTIDGKELQTDFGYKKHFTYMTFSKEILDYLMKSNVCFEMKGNPVRKKKIPVMKKKEEKKEDKKVPMYKKKEDKEV